MYGSRAADGSLAAGTLPFVCLWLKLDEFGERRSKRESRGTEDVEWVVSERRHGDSASLDGATRFRC